MSCPVCDSDDIAQQSPGITVSVKFGGFESNLCGNCGTFYNPKIAEDYVRDE